jgi:BTB/POZ domain
MSSSPENVKVEVEAFLTHFSPLNTPQVLSVCSPYFQKIFIEHPSTHPILFMTDVNSNHMAGLLDFMYSGQVDKIAF